MGLFKRTFIAVTAYVVALFLSSYASVTTDFMPYNITVADGLSQNSVKTIYRDSRGFVWIGTDYGLNRYDNQSVKSFLHNTGDETSGSITSDKIVDVFEDNTKRIWVIAERGISVYNPQTEHFDEITYNGEQIKARTHYLTENGVILGSAARLYICKDDSLSIDTLKINGGPTDKRSSFIAIHPWSNGNLLLTTRNEGLWSYDIRTGDISKIGFVTFPRIIAASSLNQGHLWVSPINGGVYCFKRDGRLVKKFDKDGGLSDNNVTSLSETTDYVYVTTEKGIDIIDKKKMTLIPNALSDCGRTIGSIGTSFIDRFGNLYAGTTTNGLVIMQSVPIRTFRLSPEKPVESQVTTIIPLDSTRLICGTDGAGVMMFDSSTDRISHFSSTEGMKVIGMVECAPGQFFICVYGGDMSVLDIRTGELRPAPNQLKQITDHAIYNNYTVLPARIDSRRILIAADSVHVFDTSDNSVKPVKTLFEKDHFHSLYPFYASSSEAYLFGFKHIYRFDADKMTFDRILTTPDNYQLVRAAQYDGRDNIYFATPDSVFVYSLDKHTTTPMDLEGINNIKTLKLENGNLWIGTHKKMYLYDKLGTLRAFDSSNGLLPNEFVPRALYADDRFLYFGGSSGLVRINRRQLDLMATDRENGVEINLAEIILNGKSAMRDIRNGHLTVPSRGATVQIKIVENERNALRHKNFYFLIEGINNDMPFKSTTRSMRFSDLPTGVSLKVKVACDLPNGEISEWTDLVVLDVEQVWWKSWWFITILVALALLACWMVYLSVQRRKRSNANRRRRNMLEHDVQILANINEGLRTPLNKVYEPLIDAIAKLEGTEDAEASDALGDINFALDNVESMRELVESPFNMLHSKNLNIASIILTARFNVWLSELLVSYAHAHRFERRIQFGFNPDYDPGTMTFDANRYEMILTCLLADLLSGDTNRINVDITSNDANGNVRITLSHDTKSDSDKNTEEKQQPENLRVVYARWLAEISGATLKSETGHDGHITAATLEIPLTKDSSVSADNSDNTRHQNGQDNPILEEATIMVVGADSSLTDSIKVRAGSAIKRIVCAESYDCVSKARKYLPDVVVVDGSANEAAAVAICRKIKSVKEMDHTPIILLTDGIDNGIKDRSSDYIADAYLAKPFDIGVLLRICRRLISASRHNHSEESGS